MGHFLAHWPFIHWCPAKHRLQNVSKKHPAHRTLDKIVSNRWRPPIYIYIYKSYLLQYVYNISFVQRQNSEYPCPYVSMQILYNPNAHDTHITYGQHIIHRQRSHGMSHSILIEFDWCSFQIQHLRLGHLNIPSTVSAPQIITSFPNSSGCKAWLWKK